MNTTLTRSPDLGETHTPHADTADIKKTIERAIAQVETARVYVGQIDDDLYSDNNTLIHSVTAMVSVEKKLAERGEVAEELVSLLGNIASRGLIRQCGEKEYNAVVASIQ